MKLAKIRVRLMFVSVLVFWLMASRPVDSVFSCLSCALCSGLILSKNLVGEVLYGISPLIVQKAKPRYPLVHGMVQILWPHPARGIHTNEVDVQSHLRRDRG